MISSSFSTVSLNYLPLERATAWRNQAFRRVEGPQRLEFTERGATKAVHIWRADGLRWDQERSLRQFNFLTWLEVR